MVVGSGLMPRRLLLAVTCAATIASFAPRAHAYRPFDGTDADVAHTGEIELEVGPVGYIAEGKAHALTTPSFVFNYGLVPRLELVLEGHGRTAIDNPGDEPRVRFQDGGAFLKGLLRKGVLQDDDGMSIASELGPLVPETGDARWGASWAFIFSERNSAGTIHLNTAALLTRAHNASGFLGVILEGPYDLPVRPVAEFYVADELTVGHTASGLVGFIWEATDEFSFDAALRYARVQDIGVSEVRLGFTWAFPVFE